jgi:hypothetical protein
MLTIAGFVNITIVRAYDGTEPQNHDVIAYCCQRV